MKVIIINIIDKKTLKAQSSILKKHTKYGKFITHTKVFLVDYNGEKLNVGQEIEIVNSRPISKNKKWKLKQ